MLSSSPVASRAKVVPFVRNLASHGDRLAIVTPDARLSYRQLASRVTDAAARLDGDRRLVLLAGTNTIDSVVWYLGALTAGHAVLLAPDNPRTIASLSATYNPDLIIAGDADSGGDGGRLSVDERRTLSAHDLHPDLALLLTTSGSTGAAKVVRLSHDNLQSNAEAIAGYLSITADDRAATTLPVHYCYGLSVIHTHLLRGAALVLTDRSVSDPAFWTWFRASGATTFAGVPYTFELLDRIGFDSMRLPTLRYVTQAGGRLAPDRVRRLAELGRRDGWDLFVMYGQTEATARMAYLPPELAATRPHCVGVPIPGGSFRLVALPDRPDPEAGELVYTGPNVMLGYAETAAELSLGRTIAELHTGDLARRTDDGLYEIIGRRGRFLKVFGLRIDLDHVEATLARHGTPARCVGADDELVVAVSGVDDAGAGRLRRLAARESGLPERAVRICVLPELPRLTSGKPDYSAIESLTRRPSHQPPPAPAHSRRRHGAEPADLRAIFAEVLGRPDATEQSTFVGLGGDSLSYVEMSIRLEQALGHLPDGWHTTPIDQLRAAARPHRRKRRRLDTSAALRAVSIVLIVGTHAQLFAIAGGAHLLLGVAGFNFGRFHLTSARHRERLRRMSRSVSRIIIASVSWIALATLVTGDYSLAKVLLANYIVGPTSPPNEFWFIEALVYNLVVLAALLAIPAVDRLERRVPFGLPVALMAAGLITRYQLVPGIDLRTPAVVFWLVALGWAGAKANTAWQRVLVTVAIVTTLPGFVGELRREAVMMVGLALLVWIPTVPSTRTVNRAVGLLAGASLYIYLTHWQVYPHLMRDSALVAVVASIAVGVGYAALATRAPAIIAAIREAIPAPLRRPRARDRFASIRLRPRRRSPDDEEELMRTEITECPRSAPGSHAKGDR